jgi:hypothetical protein
LGEEAAVDQRSGKIVCALALEYDLPGNYEVANKKMIDA